MQADAPCLGGLLPTGPLVGDQTLAFEILELPADLGLSMLTYSAEPGTRSEEAMRELARWRKVAAAPGDGMPAQLMIEGDSRVWSGREG